jgi:putative phosphoribosyl transferase
MAEKRYRNRLHAGQVLAERLAPYAHGPALVLALPRGGVPVGFAVAERLGLALDVLVVRKLGLPGHPEYAMGAVGGGGVGVLQPEVLARHGVAPAAVEAAVAREQAEVARRERAFRGGRPPLQLAGTTVLLVDDGLATGATMQAAIAVARAGGAARAIAAVPVGAAASCEAIAALADEFVCPRRPASFGAVSLWYRAFEQTGDAEVRDLLALAWHRLPGRTGAARAPPAREPPRSTGAH